MSKQHAQELIEYADLLEPDDYPLTAAHLRRVAAELVMEEQDFTERLAVAGENAAAAQQLADELRAQLDGKEAAVAHYKRLATDATRLTGDVVKQLVRERQANKTAQRAIAYLLSALGQDEDVEVHVSASDDVAALDPKYLTDILCALAGVDPRPSLDSGNEPETT